MSRTARVSGFETCGDGVRDDQRKWQVMAIAAYARTQEEARMHVRRHLAERLLALTGTVLAEQAIVEDTATPRATAVVDGVVFCLRRSEVVVVRPCVYCETGRFESPPVASRSDLGYALAAWEPYHHGCEPVDLADDVSW
jgi:hypothetical protein